MSFSSTVFLPAFLTLVKLKPPSGSLKKSIAPPHLIFI
jgi:hypothetical protein